MDIFKNTFSYLGQPKIVEKIQKKPKIVLVVNCNHKQYGWTDREQNVWYFEIKQTTVYSLKAIISMISLLDLVLDLGLHPASFVLSFLPSPSYPSWHKQL